MAVTVLDSKDLITHLTTGETPVPAGIAEDNAKQKAAADKESGKTTAVTTPEDKKPPESEKKGATNADDDMEGEDGLTPRQKRELSATMLKAIGKKHREMKEAEEFAADQYNNRRLAEQRAQELEAELAKWRKPPAKVEAPKEPKREDFQTDAAFADAIIDYKVEQKLRKTQAEEAQRRAEAEQAAIVSAAQDCLKAAAALVPDFEETIDIDLNVPGHIAAYMQRSPLFAELGYHLAKHPEVLAELRKLPPAEALVEVGVIKSTLKPFSETHKGDEKAANGAEPSKKSNGESTPSTTGESPSKPRGTAPVITPLSSGSSSQVEKAPAEMSTREMIQAWQKKEGRNLGLRKRH
jgi:hypothetical protein